MIVLEVFGLWLSVIVLVCHSIGQPKIVRCPEAFYVEGVRRDGRSTCASPVARNCGEPTGPYQQDCPDNQFKIQTRIYCTGGSIPIVIDHQTIGCQRP